MQKKITWVKFWTRNFGLFRYWVYIESNRLPFYKKHFGKVFDYALTVPNGKLMEYYHDEDELQDLTKRMFKVACKDFKTFDKYSKQIFKWMQEFIDFNNKLNLQQLAKLSNKQLVVRYKKWYKKYLYWQTGIYFYFVLEPILTDIFQTSLEKYLNKNKLVEKISKYNEIIMSPEAMNAVALDQLMALETVINIKNNPDQKKNFIQIYWKNFLWIPCYDVKDDEYQLSHFEEIVNKLFKLDIKELVRKYDSLNNEFGGRRTSFLKLLNSIKDKRLAELTKIMHWLVYYKDHRDDKRREASFAAKKFMSFLANKFDLTLEEINYLTPPELMNLLKGKGVINKKEIKARIPVNYVLLSTPGKIEFFSGEKIKEILYEQMPKNNVIQEKIVKGTVGSKGYAKGKVVIVRHSVALSKVKDGDVLVAVTTHPEYVSAMKKAAAIVTDEGGITSHAAIVAREMKKPCIVGTKNVTQILQDGDLVEVDAEKGIIRILK